MDVHERTSAVENDRIFFSECIVPDLRQKPVFNFDRYDTNDPTCLNATSKTTTKNITKKNNVKETKEGKKKKRNKIIVRRNKVEHA